MSRPSVTRALLALAAVLLLAGTAYGALAPETRERTEAWNGRRGVESGYCSREYALLPARSPRPPDFIRFGDRTYVRGEEEVRRPPGLQDTDAWRGSWRLKRAGRLVYLETAGRPTVLPYSRGECPE